MSNKLKYSAIATVPKIDLPSSKSISNRLLIAQALSGNTIVLENLSEAEDTVLLQKALASNEETVNVGMAGTAFRFLTAYYSVSKVTRILTGSERMLKRPIGVLVEKLKKLGADITYLKNDGFPPLKIVGKRLKGGPLSIDASVSSQYISALLLIAPHLENGLQLRLKGEVVSLPYIDLTIDLQQQIGIDINRDGSLISVKNGAHTSNLQMVVEADWSSAAFFYQIVALSRKSLFINNLSPTSRQGDINCFKIFEELGVKTEFLKEGALLTQHAHQIQSILNLDMTETPDLIPPVAVVASQLCSKISITGTKTLYIKECNRVAALKTELAKLSVELNEVDGNCFEIQRSDKTMEYEKGLSFLSYDDHRMAMSLAPLAIRYKIEIDSLDVVVKSFPTYWIEMKKVGIFI
jgi:3-phosphoshikimate 1-carboxyvinyltransferase